jgi:5-methylcytosine-specific restriction protein A
MAASAWLTRPFLLSARDAGCLLNAHGTAARGRLYLGLVVLPYALKKPCRYPGCAELTHSSYCEKHMKQVGHDYEKYRRDPDAAKRYNGAWRRIRAQYIAAHPLCEMCQREGRLVPATEVHHIVELSEGGGNSFDNLMALCKPCHSRLGKNWQK